jgi:hypothetical protein
MGRPAAKRHAFKYPFSEMLRPGAIGETVPVYRGHIVREIHLRTRSRSEAVGHSFPASWSSRDPSGIRHATIGSAMCRKMPLEWHFKYEGLDRQRAPSEFQRKPN